MKLTSENVEMVFSDCLFGDDEDILDPVKVEVILSKFEFHCGRIAKHREDIESMLDQLPDGFKQNSGGGWTFLNMCNDKDDNQWTDMHAVMEQLVALGLAINKVRFTMPRDMWPMLPGGMPYIIIKEKV